MNRRQTNNCATDLLNLLIEVHRLATGRELRLEEAVGYFGDPRRLASVVKRSGILCDRAKRRKFETLMAEARNGI